MIILYELLRETPNNYTAFSLSLNFQLDEYNLLSFEKTSLQINYFFSDKALYLPDVFGVLLANITTKLDPKNNNKIFLDPK